MIRLIALSVCAILSLSAQVGGPGAPATGGGVFSQIASQAEAEAGSNNTKGMTPLRTAEAIAALAAGGTQSMVVNAQTGTTYTVLTTDRAKLVTFCNASPVAVTLPQAGVSFPDGWYFFAKNICAGDVTITPTTSTLSGAASIVLSTGEMAPVASDGTNYEALSNRLTDGSNVTLTKSRTGSAVSSEPSGTTSTCFQLETGGTGPKLCDEANGLQIKTSADAVMATLTTAGVLTLGDGTAPWNLTGLTDDVAPGAPASSNQFTSYIDRTTGLFNYHLNGDANPKVPALGKWATFTGPTAARSYALPDADATIPRTIYSGTKALDTDAIASEACDTITAVTATGVASTDIVTFTPNADITAVTGYAPVTEGGLSIYVWPSADAINIKVCNPTSSSITPGAVTLNLRVTR